MGKLAAGLIGAILVSGGAGALRPHRDSPSPPRLVRVEVREGSRIVARPQVVLSPAAPAAVTIGGADGFAMTLRLDPAGGGSVFRASLYRPDRGAWKLVDSPSTPVAAGRPAQLAGSAGRYAFSATL